MKFVPMRLPGAFLIEPEPHRDERGFFARTFCREEFAAHGLVTDFVQSSVSYNRRKGTLRGMHYQTAPHEEVKLVRCTMGAIHDVILDLRPESTAFKSWAAVELSAVNRRTLYVPTGVAHGFLTLMDETELLYEMSEPFHSDCSSGVRWDDVAFAINWPGEIQLLNERDRGYPAFLG